MNPIRYINSIFTLETGVFNSNNDLLGYYEEAVDKLDMDVEEKEKLHKAVKYFLVGQRTRRVVDGWLDFKNFDEKAAGFERGIDESIAGLSLQLSEAFADKNISFDAVFTISATGTIMPGISYRLARLLPDLIRPNSLIIDLGHVGCTGGVKALNLAKSLSSDFKNILVVSIEVPCTLANLQSKKVDVWQGNCTFGDGAAALWISSDAEQGDMALELEQIHYTQKAQQGLDLIHWGYDGYYSFELADETTFNRDVQAFVLEVLKETEQTWRSNKQWAIHPAGILLLLKLSKKLGLPRGTIAPSVAHYEKFSNMSSASIMYILKEIAKTESQNQAINLLTMGAGFNVIYGCVKKVR